MVSSSPSPSSSSPSPPILFRDSGSLVKTVFGAEDLAAVLNPAAAATFLSALTTSILPNLPVDNCFSPLNSEHQPLSRCKVSPTLTVSISSFHRVNFNSPDSSFILTLQTLPFFPNFSKVLGSSLLTTLTVKSIFPWFACTSFIFILHPPFKSITNLY